MANQYDNSKRVLLVIDVQEDDTGKTARSPFPYKNSIELIENINFIINKSKEKNIDVIYTKHEVDHNFLSRIVSRGRFTKNSSGSNIDSRIKIVSNYIFSKNELDVSVNPQVHRVLKQKNADEIFIVGVDAKYCVRRTALSALMSGYRVTIIRDAITTLKINHMPRVFKSYEKHGINLISMAEF